MAQQLNTLGRDECYDGLKFLLDRFGVDRFKVSIQQVWRDMHPPGRVVFNTSHGPGVP